MSREIHLENYISLTLRDAIDTDASGNKQDSDGSAVTLHMGTRMKEEEEESKFTMVSN